MRVSRAAVTLLFVICCPPEFCIRASEIGPSAQVFAHVVVGSGFSTVFTITNTGGTATSGTLSITEKTGAPLVVHLSGLANILAAPLPQSDSVDASSVVLNLQAGATAIITAARPGAADTATGWASLQSAAGSLGGVATFQFALAANLKTIAGVIASQPLEAAVIPVINDEANERYSGFAVANSGSTDVHLTIAVRDEAGVAVASPIRPAELNPLRPRAQEARFLPQYLSSLVNFRGSMTISADPGEQFAVIALNQNRGLYSAVPVLPRASGWQLAWSDEFDQPDGTGPDPARWAMETGGGGWGNNELEYYTDRLDNAFIEKGSLTILAKQESFGGRNFTSARLKTQGKFSQKYGRFEARIRIPYSQGIWPAFWMLGDDIDTAGWPACGEIDIMENIGKEPAIVHGTLHGPGYSGASGIGAAYTLPGGGRFADDYHVYAIEWDSDSVRWYVDGNLYHTVKARDIPAGTRWVFDHTFFILLNVAVGGNWPGYPNSTTVFPQKMQVDYVRVYRRTQ